MGSELCCQASTWVGVSTAELRNFVFSTVCRANHVTVLLNNERNKSWNVSQSRRVESCEYLMDWRKSGGDVVIVRKHAYSCLLSTKGRNVWTPNSVRHWRVWRLSIVKD